MKEISSVINKFIVETLLKYGYTISKTRHPEIVDEDWKIYEKIKSLTMTPIDRIFSLIESMKYVAENKIEGDFVECGVWRGGNAVLASEIFSRYDITDRKIWLYDTYDGMVEPEEIDRSSKGEIANEIYNNMRTRDGGSKWSLASLDFVRNALSTTSYPSENFVLVKGKVEDTLSLPQNIPDKISLLRLDTDWYSSTKAEMEFLYSKLVKGGIIIIDDYGDWQGSRKAVDEFFEANDIKIPLFRLGSGARIGVKF